MCRHWLRANVVERGRGCVQTPGFGAVEQVGLDATLM